MKRLWKALLYSTEGLLSAFKHEPAFRLECYTLLLGIPLAIIIGESVIEIILLVGSILLIMIVELLNSAIENVNDRIGKEYHALCKRAKDQSSAAVFVAIVLALVVWTILVIN